MTEQQTEYLNLFDIEELYEGLNRVKVMVNSVDDIGLPPQYRFNLKKYINAWLYPNSILTSVTKDYKTTFEDLKYTINQLVSSLYSYMINNFSSEFEVIDTLRQLSLTEREKTLLLRYEHYLYTIYLEQAKDVKRNKNEQDTDVPYTRIHSRVKTQLKVLNLIKYVHDKTNLKAKLVPLAKTEDTILVLEDVLDNLKVELNNLVNQPKNLYASGSKATNTSEATEVVKLLTGRVEKDVDVIVNTLEAHILEVECKLAILKSKGMLMNVYLTHYMDYMSWVSLGREISPKYTTLMKAVKD